MKSWLYLFSVVSRGVGTLFGSGSLVVFLLEEVLAFVQKALRIILYRFCSSIDIGSVGRWGRWGRWGFDVTFFVTFFL